jgi:hypothetical protein
MCLITRQTTPIILEEDLTVYKLVSVWRTSKSYNIFHSYIQGFSYEKKVLYKTTIKRSEYPKWSDKKASKDYGFGNAKNLSQLKHLEELQKEDLVGYDRGFHSYLKRRGLLKRSSYGLKSDRIVECIIPKGSEVYYDESGLCISNQITVKKLCRK